MTMIRANCNINLHNVSGNSDKNCLMDNIAMLEPIITILLSSVIFVLAVVGNTLVTWILSNKKHRNKPTNMFIVNLALSDLVLAVACIPFTLAAMIMEEFSLGAVMCVIIRYLQAVSIAVNCFTLVAISLERYYAICEPFRSRRWQTLRHAYTVIAVTWLVALVVTIPVAASHRLVSIRTGKHACREVWNSYKLEWAYTFFLDAIIVVLPITVMSVAYLLIANKLWSGMESTRDRDSSVHLSNGRFAQQSSGDEDESSGRYLTREVSTETNIYHMRVSNYERNLANKRKVVKMLLVVVLEYFICWTPIFIVTTWMAVDYQHARQRISPMTKSLLHLLSYISSCCNPITYCFMNSKFRQGFLAAFRCCVRSPLPATRTFTERENLSLNSRSTNRIAQQRRDN